jgi:ATP-dependent protease HslVU (ClpYQ) peptidase subunit
MGAGRRPGLYGRLEGLEEFGGTSSGPSSALRTGARAPCKAVIIVTGEELPGVGERELLQPDEEDGVLPGSGANFAPAAARALMRHTQLSASEIVREAMKIAAEICIFTNDRLTVEEL